MRAISLALGVALASAFVFVKLKYSGAGPDVLRRESQRHNWNGRGEQGVQPNESA